MPSLPDETRRNLLIAAHAARQKAYAPYSHYRVGAALLASNGATFSGCNIENAAYSPTVCAERVAIFKAVSEGVMNFEAMAVVTSNGGVCCGVCRPGMHEVAPDMTVIAADAGGKIGFEGPLPGMVPEWFWPGL